MPAATAATRSLSCARVCAMPVSSVGRVGLRRDHREGGEGVRAVHHVGDDAVELPSRRTVTLSPLRLTLQPMSSISSKKRASP